ncbi:MAG: ECF transporter S component, partial [Acidimicrobiales bacterium]
MSAPARTGRDRSALRMAPRTAAALLVASVAGLAMFAWPLVIDPPADFSHTRDAPYVFALILPVLVAIVLAEMTSRGMDTKALAMLGVLSAIGAALRPLGAGTGGIELVFFLLVLGGRVYGPAFGFVLGSTTLFASALLTGGMGPWLPFQMLASSWVGLLAGLLPPARGRVEIAMLAAYAGVSAYLYGFLVNLWGWPFALGAGLAWVFFHYTQLFPEKTRLSEAMLFLGASMCITAFPMLARIIQFKGLAGTTMGPVALGAG